MPYVRVCLFGPMRKNKVAADGVKARNQTSEVLDKDRLEADKGQTGGCRNCQPSLFDRHNMGLS